MSNNTVNRTEGFEIWANLSNLATVNAMTGISKMIDREIQISRVSFRGVPVLAAHDLLGSPNETIIGVYLTYGGAAAGHIVLAFPQEVAFELIDLAMSREPGTTTELNELEASVMGEMGNISGSFFLNEVSDGIGATIQPSPPAVICDMAGAIMDIIVSQVLATHDDLYLIDLSFRFTLSGNAINGKLLVVPTEGVFSPAEGLMANG
jgi:chemotaxis protein CheC